MNTLTTFFASIITIFTSFFGHPLITKEQTNVTRPVITVDTNGTTKIINSASNVSKSPEIRGSQSEQLIQISNDTPYYEDEDIYFSYPKGWSISSSTPNYIPKNLQEQSRKYREKHSENKYKDIYITNTTDNSDVVISITTDPTTSGGSLIDNLSKISNTFTIDKHTAFRNSLPEDCTDGGESFPINGYCFHVSFIDQYFKPIPGYEGSSNDLIQFGDKKYIFKYHIPLYTSTNNLKEMDNILETVRFK